MTSVSAPRAPPTQTRQPFAIYYGLPWASTSDFRRLIANVLDARPTTLRLCRSWIICWGEMPPEHNVVNFKRRDAIAKAIASNRTFRRHSIKRAGGQFAQRLFVSRSKRTEIRLFRLQRDFPESYYSFFGYRWGMECLRVEEQFCNGFCKDRVLRGRISFSAMFRFLGNRVECIFWFLCFERWQTFWWGRYFG